MATFRVNKDKNYTTINNTGLKDKRLSWKAKGILAYILTLPDDWVFYREELSRHAKDGLDSLRAGMKELKEYGYLKRFPVRDDNNKIIKWETIIYEVPQNDPVEEKPPVEIPPEEKPPEEKPPEEKPPEEKPPVEKPPVENPELLSTKELNTKELSTDIQSSSSIFSFYENNFGILNSFIAENISQWVNDTSEELVQAAMERALKQQKKWNYAEGILKQWINNNVKTLKDVDALETEYQRKKGVKKRVGINRKSDDSDSEYIGL
ncbi:DnaD domain protein [Bacillus thuringiensis]|uniref:DnaD domain protein n=1 Tax=Bacillus thuringiensis TaxID=1428 RepID=A0A0B5NHY9_BACTU|nr:DnaD domain protein [Bacillus thuringiensis]MCU5427590.1 DnaD domain protein [Bacillus cereus]AJG75985.1 DnaD domain protein [Bacillus thuringiensis]EEM78223.1 Phage replication protein [Bacillus thuringiensis serovar pondicheriensis BGSC 4BA1]OTX45174.1 replication protein [Bacillus thuringiensis serovar pondicheriensis]QKH26668.1 DnaD domain protein [Bacillus thuringiensis]